ncbi:N-(5'-phosphoribosyl)anthranilate isomerase [Bacteroidia bacterium]|nr:N-(5'-phosphoribosyl)anthranilate isomerase [Bacteroidia bacterium]
MLIKVCGMRDAENIRELSALSVDFIGFIFYAKSPRYVSTPSALWRGIEVGRRIEGKGKTVGVFVNETNEQILKIVHAPKPSVMGDRGLDYIQLHGNEPPQQCADLKQSGNKVIKAFPIAKAEDLEQTKQYEGIADYFIFDTKCDDCDDCGAYGNYGNYGNYGGSGKSFDWSVLQSYGGNTPFLLSGGINPDSVKAIRAFSHPQFAGIDLNSGFETVPAMKDIQKLKTFIESLKT